MSKKGFTFIFSGAALAVLSAGVALGWRPHNLPAANFDHQQASLQKWHDKQGADIVNASNKAHFLGVHEQAEIDIVLQAQVNSGSASIHLETDDGVMIASAQTDWQFDLSQTQEMHLPVILYGAREGSHYVHIFVQQVDAFGNHSARALAQQINVGDAGLVKQRYKSAGAPQDPFVSLPASEVIF